MPLVPEPKDKLLPLRKFAVPGVYSAAYLSQLVQRKRLRATQIGRNYYTTAAWFEEYVSRHGRDCKQERYGSRQISVSEPLTQTVSGIHSASATAPANVSSVFPWQTVAILLVAVFLLLVGQWFFISLDKGRIAGDSYTATSTE